MADSTRSTETNGLHIWSDGGVRPFGVYRPMGYPLPKRTKETQSPTDCRMGHNIGDDLMSEPVENFVTDEAEYLHSIMQKLDGISSQLASLIEAIIERDTDIKVVRSGVEQVAGSLKELASVNPSELMGLLKGITGS
jgi:archaellum component FlaC